MNVLYNIIVAPIETIIDWVFLFYNHYIGVLGIAGGIIAVSLAINFLALPIYNKADNLQEKERNLQKKMEYRIKRIKKAFTGDERFMMLQTYYRQNEYSPIYALRSSISILIQIPFFMAAYHYLSHSESLIGASFYFINDLGKQDALFSIGSFQINILPILMTLINIISASVYTKTFPLREKIQVYILAAVFLILLYNSPSGLVFYWILNNLFSLVKNIVKKTKCPLQIMHVFISILFLAMQGYFWWKHPLISIWKKTALTIFAVIFTIVPIFWVLAKKLKLKDKILQTKFYMNMMLLFSHHEKSDTSVFVLSCIGLWLLAGFVLPSSVIATSPIEFSFLGETDSPLVYISTAIYVFAGFFVLWPFVIYKMFGEKVQRFMSPLFFVLLVCAIANVYIFKYDYGTLNAIFVLDNNVVLKNVSPFFSLFPIFVMAATICIYYICKINSKINILCVLVFSICMAECFFSAYKTHYIKTEYTSHKNNITHKTDISTDDVPTPIYHLSRDKQNVVVFFLDRAISSFFPLIVQQFPELAETFSGFTYYPNTLTFALSTINGAPALMGGYEYTPEKMNERSNELLVNKHNEATLVMPKLFLDAGFDVTFTDPPLPNYRWSGDFSAFSNFPEVHVSETAGNYLKKYFEPNIKIDTICIKEIRNFSLLQMIYPPLRRTFYIETNSATKHAFSVHNFSTYFASMYFLNDQTDFENTKPSFNFIVNRATHEPTYLNVPLYDMPSNRQPNSTGFYKAKGYDDTIHYHANAAVIKKIGEWLNFLKQNKAYDNTRIIIVSDHGRNLNLTTFKNFSDPTIPSTYNALLIVKDFDAKGNLKTDNSFMTNADTIFFATKNITNDINPFTGKKFIAEKDNGISVHATYSREWIPDEMRNKTQFTLNKANAFHVHDDIFNPKNWEKLQ